MDASDAMLQFTLLAFHIKKVGESSGDNGSAEGSRKPRRQGILRAQVYASYTFANGLRAYTSVINLTNKPQVSYAGYPQFVEDTSLSGRKWTFGVEFSF